MARQPNTAELLEAFDTLTRALTSSFSLYVWMTRLLPKLEPHRGEIDFYITIGQNAAIQASLVSIRALDDFFLPSDDAKFDHDVIAATSDLRKLVR